MLNTSEQFVIAEVQKFLAHRFNLPIQPAWSRSATARYLKKQGLLGAQKATITQWELELCWYIKDYRDRWPLDKEGNPKSGYPLSQYQFSVIVRLAYVLTHLRPYLNGSRYIGTIQKTVKNREIQRRYLSYAVWQYDQTHAA